MAQALSGIRILDLSNIVAGPWSTTLLSDFGAEVVKVEMPAKGDPLRELPPLKNGVGLWWKVANRNKKAMTIDLHRPQGQELVRRLVAHVDVLVENFRPGTLDGWGLSRDALQAINPKLIILRVTAFGQTGPYRNRPGFARIAEAISGLTYLCGESDRAPLHMGYPVADALAGLFGALSIMIALQKRNREPDARGEEIDVSLFESVFRMLDFLAIEYDQIGTVRERTGNRSQYGAPGNVYRTKDGQWASIAASSQSIFERLARTMGRSDLITDPRFRTNPERVKHYREIDAIVGDWIAERTLAEVSEQLVDAEVGFSPIFSIAQIFEDPHFRAREALISVNDDELGPVRMQGVIPKFTDSPGIVKNAAPTLGAHTREILSTLLSLSDKEIDELERSGAV
ncbi:MAG TPA: CoA transferase [Candidatus Acidoferrales bacterium]|nr:CoA transferase [Candidatus Acidoferrales bacterium]